MVERNLDREQELKELWKLKIATPEKQKAAWDRTWDAYIESIKPLEAPKEYPEWMRKPMA